MSPSGKDIHITARMGSRQPSLHPAGGVNVTVNNFFLSFFVIRFQPVFMSSILGAGKRVPTSALIHGEYIPGGFALHVM